MYDKIGLKARTKQGGRRAPQDTMTVDGTTLLYIFWIRDMELMKYSGAVSFFGFSRHNRRKKILTRLFNFFF